MEDLGWDGGAEVIDNPALWSNIYAPQHFFNYCTEVSTVAVPNQEIHRLSQPFADNNNSKHSISATKVVEPAIVAPAPLWQHQNNVVHSLGTIAPAGHVGGGILAQDDTLNGIVSMKASLDSLDCLFSATNSNTDTSLEDDGGTSSPSVVFTENPRSFWSFGPTVAVSSAESERNNNISNDKAKVDKEGTTNINTKKRERTNNVDNHDGGFRLISKPDLPKQKRLRSGKSGYSLTSTTSSNISFQLQPSSPTSSIDQAEPDQEAIAQMKEMIYRAAAFRPVNLGPEGVEMPKRKNVKISSDPQTVAARQRRERISERIRVLQKLVPGGTKMDTASMLDEAANYLKFLQNQIKALENLGPKSHDNSSSSSTTPNCYTTSGLNLAFSSTPLSHSLLGPIQAHLPLLNIPYHYRPQF